MCIDYLKKIGGLCFYNAKKNDDAFIKNSYVLGSWLLVFSIPSGFALFSIDSFLILPLLHLDIIPNNRILGLLFVFIHVIPPAIFYYFLFIYKHKYLKYMELYKDYPKRKVFYYYLSFLLAWFVPPILFTIFRESWGV